jgi:hypothetical protein
MKRRLFAFLLVGTVLVTLLVVRAQHSSDEG